MATANNTAQAAELQSQLAALQAQLKEASAENERLRAAKSKLTPKVSEKGAMSVYGLGKWPFTLYKSQWKRLLAEVPALQQFLADHDSELVDKE